MELNTHPTLLQTYPSSRKMLFLSHFRKWKSEAKPGLTAGLAVPMYSHTKNTTDMLAKA